MWRTEDDVQRMLRSSADAWAADHAGPEPFRRFRAQGTGMDAAQWAALAELGWTGLLLPEAAGGSDIGFGAALTLAEVFGRHLVMSPFVPSAVVAATLLASGTESPEAAGLASGALVPLPALRENATGAMTLPETVFATERITGRKGFIPGWHDGAALVVSAMDGVEMVLAVVAADASGVTAQAQRMADGTLAAEVTFSDCPAREILRGAAAEAAVTLATAREALALCAMLEGLSTKLFELTVDYVRQRVQFDKPLANFQTLRHALVDIHTQNELAGASWRLAARALENGDPEAGRRLAAARARAGRAAHEMAKAAIQYHGAFGYTEEADIGLYVNAIQRLASQGGGAAAWRLRALAAHKELAHAGH